MPAMLVVAVVPAALAVLVVAVKALLGTPVSMKRP